jgi:hypothetical protein
MRVDEPLSRQRPSEHMARSSASMCSRAVRTASAAREPMVGSQPASWPSFAFVSAAPARLGASSFGLRRHQPLIAAGSRS